MNKRILSVTAALLILSGCDTSKKAEESPYIKADCSNVNSQIDILEKEKKENNKRIKAGIKTVLPITTVANVIRGAYGDNTQVPTSEWSATINANLKELYVLREHCKKK